MTISPASLASAALLLLGLGGALLDAAGKAAGWAIDRQLCRWANDTHEPLWLGDE